MASHTGTHLDAPLHKLAGSASIDAMPLEAFSGMACCADLQHLAPEHSIGSEDLEAALGSIPPNQIILLVTGWGLKRNHTDEWLYRSPRLSPDGARWLVERKVRGVGIDHFSIGGTIEPANASTHEILLGAGVWIIEELCFRAGWKEASLAPGCRFQALPLHLPGFSGSPCRAVFVLP